jgi:hypothetical protein
MVAVEKAVGMREMRPYGFEVGHGEARLFWRGLNYSPEIT